MKKYLLMAIAILSIPRLIFSMNFYSDGIPIFPGDHYEQKKDGLFYIDDNKRLLNQGQLLQFPGECYFYDHLKDAYYEDRAQLEPDGHCETQLTSLCTQVFSLSLSENNNNNNPDVHYRESRAKKFNEWIAWQNNGKGYFTHYVMPFNKEQSLCIPLHVSSPYHIPLQKNDVTKAVEFWHAIEDQEFHEEVKFMEEQLLQMKCNLDKVSWIQVISNFSAYQTFKKQYGNLTSELEWLTDPNNRDAFSRMHIPQQYFSQVKEFQVRQSNKLSFLQQLFVHKNYLMGGALVVAFFYYLSHNSRHRILENKFFLIFSFHVFVLLSL